ncbi:MAG TPA: hypothetical protein GXX14_00175 [Clostridiaceae bacterium]|nr:hypothetical protein [Clostridiaceae bacterium]
MSPFEILMLLCFGAAWPFSIYRSYTSKKIEGKSVMFLLVLEIGYIAGILHKLIYSFDGVIILYGLNCIMMATDIFLYFRNKRLCSRGNNIQENSKKNYDIAG